MTWVAFCREWWHLFQRRTRAAEIYSLHRIVGWFDLRPPLIPSLSSEHILRSHLRSLEFYPQRYEFESRAAVFIRRILDRTDSERRDAVHECLHWLECEAAALSEVLGTSNYFVSRAAGRKSALARALGVLAAHPDWTDKKIAAEAGVSRTSLYKWPTYVRARAAARQAGKAHRATRAISVSVQARKRNCR